MSAARRCRSDRRQVRPHPRGCCSRPRAPSFHPSPTTKGATARCPHFGCTFRNPGGGAAGRLIDAAGLKGVRRGGAEVSRVHANFLVNLGEATTADMLALMNLMREEVKRTGNVLLEPEVRLLGTSFPWERSGAGPKDPPDIDE